MFELSNIVEGLNVLLSGSSMLAILIGTIIGIIVGALPGASATMAIAVMIPITFWFSAEFSLLMLISVYCSGIFGGAITAILLNIPGTPASAATSFDGYPLARSGQGGKAIAVAIWSSFIGGLLSGIALLFAAPALATLALRFGPPESMMVALFGLTMVASLSSENLAKGLLMGALGMFMGCIGLDPTFGYARFTFGSPNLYSGIPVVPLLIGVFSVPEVINMLTSKGWDKVVWDRKTKIRISFKEFKSIIKTCGVSAAIGMIIGLIPAIGPETATFIGYDQAKKMSENKEMFGKGAIEGVAASECANNAVVGTSLAPMFALGIPGSGAAMVLMGGLMIHGLMPGPRLFTEHKSLLMTIFLGFIVAQFFMLVGGLIAAKFSPAILNISHTILGPSILIICMVGSFAVSNNIFDVYVMLIAGFISYFMGKAGFAPVPTVLGLILGPMFEGEVGRTIRISSKTGFLPYILGRPITLLLAALTILTIALPIIFHKGGQKEVSIS
ncbi:MAG TPA: tripartite tricarboxylate transporter permease [Tepidanaerobacteraceae bacterium]|nr:tripartite tricarboxylate transporter permease [Tepidanaerobacteraceae bacterium]HQE06025.1 tripartite tricarboxylate transporter permease [Tepidanaerobacteraceae bacterium]